MPNPENTKLPTITGIATQGFGETEVPGTWKNGPILTTTYQWKRDPHS